MNPTFEQRNMGDGNVWEDELGQRKYKRASVSKIREFGIDQNSLQHVDTLEDLRKSPPNIIIATATKNFSFIQNFYRTQTIKKGKSLVMGLGVFQQLQYEADSKKKLLKPGPIKFKNIFRPYRGQDLDNKSILVFRTGGIGDLLFIKPNLNYIKEKWPTCHIMFACGPQYQPMVENWDCIDEMLDLPFSSMKLKEADYHILFEGVIERCKQAHTENAYNLFSKWIGLNLPDELLAPKQKAKEFCIEETKKILSDWGVPEKDYIVMQLRASSPIRTPHHEFWIELMNRLTDLGHRIVITDNPRQNDAIKKIIDLVKNKDMIFNFCEHSKSLDYSIALAQLAKLVVATDSALNHIATSVGTACFGIYGPFPGYIRLKTYPKADWIDSVRHCSPCFIHGHTPCPQAGKDGYSPCYDELDKDEIIKRIDRMMKDD